MGVFGGFGREEPTQFLLLLSPLLKAQTFFFLLVQSLL